MTGEALTGVDLVLASDGVAATRDFVESGGSVACYAGRQGQYLGLVSIEMGESDGPVEMEYELREITPDMAEDPEIKALVEHTKAEISSQLGMSILSPVLSAANLGRNLAISLDRYPDGAVVGAHHLGQDEGVLQPGAQGS